MNCIGKSARVKVELEKFSPAKQNFTCCIEYTMTVISLPIYAKNFFVVQINAILNQKLQYPWHKSETEALLWHFSNISSSYTLSGPLGRAS